MFQIISRNLHYQLFQYTWRQCPYFPQSLTPFSLAFTSPDAFPSLSRRTMASKRKPHSQRKSQNKKLEPTARPPRDADDHDSSDELFEGPPDDFDPFGGPATREELTEYGAKGSYEEVYYGDGESASASTSEPLRTFVNKHSEIKDLPRIEAADEGGISVDGITIPGKFRKYFYESEAERARRLKQRTPSQEQVEAEESFRRQEAQMHKQQKPLGSRDWRVDEFDWPYTRRQRRVSVMLEQALNECSDMLGSSKIWFGNVEVSASLRTAKVHWNCLQRDQAKIDVFQKQLQKMAPQLRYEITQRVQMKYSPELVFVYNDGSRERTRIETEMALSKIEKIMNDPQVDARLLDDDAASLSHDFTPKR